MAFEECLRQAERSDDIILPYGRCLTSQSQIICRRHVCQLPKLLLAHHAPLLLPCTCSAFVSQCVSKKCMAVPGPCADVSSDAT